MPFRLTAVALAIASCASTVQAFNIDTGNSDVRLSLDNTVKYSTAYRLKEASPGLTDLANGDSNNMNDGDNNFDKGLVSSRLDLLTELDASYKNIGARVSAASWYDDVYHRGTSNSSTTSNHRPASEFSDATKDIMGGDAEILDAFVYGYFPVMDGMDGTVRVGRHTLLWGESLFFGSNGIAGGQGPVDVVKLSSVPNSTFKETMRPTGKISVDIPVSESASIGAYVGYEWEKSRLLPAGAYLSSGDTIEGERILAGPTAAFEKTSDVEASDSGQYGLQFKWSDYDTDTDYGFYAIRYNAAGPSNLHTILNPGPSQYRWLYAEGIEAYGASMTKTVGRWSLAGEVSYRRNAPLNSTPQSTNLFLGQTLKDNDKNIGYAVGETAHAQFSWIANVPSFIAQEASFVGEIAWNTRVKTTENESMLNPNADKSAVGLKMVYSPTYRQVFDGVDLTPSIGLGHTWGASSAVGPAFGVDGGGDINVGVKAVYLNRWKGSLSYIKYLGEEDVFSKASDSSNATYKQSLKDRDFISASVSTTF
jgi:hypothetical protein